MNTSPQEASTEIKSSINFTKKPADHFTVFILNMFGSISFLIGFIVVIALWLVENLDYFPFLKPFDPFPCVILELAVSIFAVMLSVIVLINQNRQRRIETIRQQIEFEINVRAENEITKMLQMLHEIQQKMGLESKEDQELEQMKTRTDIKQIHKTLDENLAPNQKTWSD